ncbi:hypothetical protein [Croceibacterium aestuarii]|uniref:hypothetical protein n=1 Tax=Croceibacterium aestuarii TaxID=3064139 RepID=UPI00272E5ABC|nr:hypothetical protein [Croceibacterium sp. D39]
MSVLQHIARPGSAFRAVQFKAWQVLAEDQGNPRHEAKPVDLPEWVETAKDAADCACTCLMHKSSILVLRSDASLRPERRHLLSVFVVRKKSNPGWVRGADGKSVREHPEYPELVMQVCVGEGFDPVEPWTMRDGNAVGADLSLVEQ